MSYRVDSLTRWAGVLERHRYLLSSLRLSGLVLFVVCSLCTWIPLVGTIVWTEEINGTPRFIYSTYLDYGWAVFFTGLTSLAFLLLFLGSTGACISESKLEGFLPILSLAGFTTGVTNLLSLRYDWGRPDSKFSLEYLVTYELLWLLTTILVALWLTAFGLVVWRNLSSHLVYKILSVIIVAGVLLSLLGFVQSVVQGTGGQSFGLGLMYPISFLRDFLIVTLATGAICELLNLVNEVRLSR